MLSRPAFAVIPAAVLALAPLPLLILLPRAYAGHLDYAFAPLGVVAAILLGQARLRRSPGLWPGNPRVGRRLLVAAGAFLMVAAIFESPWGAAMAVVLTGAGFAWEMGGRPALRAVAPSLCLLALCVPLPLQLDRTFVGLMAGWSARWASHLLDLAGVAHVRSDQVLVFLGGRLDASTVLGGPFSPIALAALLLVLAQMLRRNWWRTLLIVAMGLAFLPVTAAAAIAGRIAWAGGGGPGLVFDAAGLLIAAGLAFSFDQWAGIPSALALKRPPQPADLVGTAPAGPMRSGGAVGRTAATVFAALAALQVWTIASAFQPLSQEPPAQLPERIGEWIAQPEAGNEHVAAARIYRHGDRRLELTIRPANKAESPVADLEADGWVKRSVTLVEDGTIVCARLELPGERFGVVCVSGLTDTGQTVAAPTLLFGPRARLRAALARPFGNGPAATWWVRAMSVSFVPPSSQDISEPTGVLRKASELVGKAMRAEGSP